MTFASSSSPLPSSSTQSLSVETTHTCERHPALRADHGCITCHHPLCSACARSQAHRQCPRCRVAAGKAAHVVDASWRASLLMDSLVLSFRSVPKRAPLLLGLLGGSLAVTGVFYLALSDGAGSDGEAFAFATAFAGLVFAVGLFLQPLLVLPLVRRPGLLRLLGGGCVGFLTSFLPLVATGFAAYGVEDALGLTGGDRGSLIGLAVMASATASLPVGLWWQGSVVLGERLSLRGFLGTWLAHVCVAGAWSFALSFFWLPLIAVVVAGFALGATAAGIVGVASGLGLWLLLLFGMGAFAAGTARYSDDLHRLT